MLLAPVTSCSGEFQGLMVCGWGKGALAISSLVLMLRDREQS